MMQRRLDMKKTTVFLSMLAAALLLSALPAFSGTGPYGSYGLSDNFVPGQMVETQHNAALEGTGPYGAFGPVYIGMGTPNTSVADGVGPYGAFDNFGMRGGFSAHQIANKDKCLLVATICPLDLRK
jgi:hypothetical protein